MAQSESQELLIAAADVSGASPPPAADDLAALLKREIYEVFGLSGLVVIALIVFAAFVWWTWQRSRRSQAESRAAARPLSKPLPVAAGERFALAVAGLDGDESGTFKRTLLGALGQIEGAQVLDIERAIATSGTISDGGESAAQLKAREYLGDTAAQAVLWGAVRQGKGGSLNRLVWTAPAGDDRLAEDLPLPELPRQELVDLLRLLVVAGERAYAGSAARPVEAMPVALVERVRGMVDASPGWDARTRGAVRRILGEALLESGRETEALGMFRAALQDISRERAPRRWAAVQNGLGVALARLGERESDAEQLQQAVAAFRDALKEQTREQVPLDWAETQTNLGVALAALGTSEDNPERFAEAVDAVEEAFVVYAAAGLDQFRDELGGKLDAIKAKILSQRGKEKEVGSGSAASDQG